MTGGRASRTAPASLGRNGLEPMKTRCGAKTVAGGTCKRAPMPNGRCYRHGGATPSGPASPHFLHGRYSNVLPARLRERFEVAQQDPDLFNLRAEIGLVDARIEEMLGGLAPDSETAQCWDDLLKTIELRKKLVEAEAKRLKDLRLVVPVERVMAFVAALYDSTKSHVDDRRTLRAIADDIRRLTGRGVSEAGSAGGDRGS